MDGGATEDAGAGSFAILGGLEGWWAYKYVAMWGLALFVSALLNATLLVAFVRRPGLRNISNRFVMNLIGSNLVAIVVLSGLLIMDSSSGGSGMASLGLSNGDDESGNDYSSNNYSNPTSYCAISEGGAAFVTTSSILSVLLIGVDQYLAVVDPLRYRTRIDKIKCGLLILAVWLLALSFGIVAGLNPQPRSFWYLCSANDGSEVTVKSETQESETLSLRASFFLGGNASESADLEIDGEIRFATAPSSNDNLTSARALDKNDEATTSGSDIAATYGLVYALVYAILGYLVPFLAICWIYASIYRAARNNSERTRRNGSRPILSSGSFSDECGPPGGYRLPNDCSVEDFRRIPKISSLSSIDENSEATASQLGACSNGRGPLGFSSEHVHYEDENNEVLNEEQEEEEEEDVPATTAVAVDSVVFTVGETTVEETIEQSSSSSKVPISTLRAQFLSDSRRGSKEEDEADLMARSKFPEVSEERKMSSHDVMYEEMMLGCGKHPYEYDVEDDEDDDLSDDDDEGRRVAEDVEEALPLSCAEAVPEVVSINNPGVRSNSVNFDLGGAEEDDDEEEEEHDRSGAHSPLPIVTITPPTLGGLHHHYNHNHPHLHLHHHHNHHPHHYQSHHHFSSPTMATTTTMYNRTPSVKGSSSSNGYINNLKYKISNGSLFKYREETRAARISVLVVVMGFICWTPYVYLLLARSLPPSVAQLASTTNGSGPELAALCFLALATYVTPLLFGYRSRRIKRELKRFFCFKRELSYKNNRSLMAKKVLKRRHSGATILSQFVGDSSSSPAAASSQHDVQPGRYSIFNFVYGRTRWPKDKVQFVQVPDTALAVDTCRSSFSSGASTQISSTSTDDC